MAQKKPGKKFGDDLDAEAVDRFGAWCDVPHQITIERFAHKKAGHKFGEEEGVE